MVFDNAVMDARYEPAGDLAVKLVLQDYAIGAARLGGRGQPGTRTRSSSQTRSGSQPRRTAGRVGTDGDDDDDVDLGDGAPPVRAMCVVVMDGKDEVMAVIQLAWCGGQPCSPTDAAQFQVCHLVEYCC